MFKAVIFDFDGVLIDSEIVNIEAAVRAMQAFGFELSQEDRRDVVGRDSSDYLKIFQDRLGFSEDIEAQIRTKVSEVYDGMFEGLIKLQPHVKEILEFLRAKEIIMGIATGNRQKRVNVFTRKYNLESYFSFSVTKDDVVKLKPNPEAYLLAKSHTPFSGDEILAIEDTEYGVISAKEAGLKCAAIPTHLTKNHDFSRADYVFGSLKEVEKLFE